MSDTLPPGVDGGVTGFCSGFWEALTPPLLLGWVLGLKALGLRDIENFNMESNQ